MDIRTEDEQLRQIIAIQKKRGQVSLNQKFSNQELEVFKKMEKDGDQLEDLDDLFEKDITENWDQDRDEKLIKSGIFKEDTTVQQSLVEKSLAEAYRISNSIGLDFDSARDMIKDFVFGMKKFEEENLKYENIQRRREKRKKLKKLSNKLQEDPFDSETDWSKDHVQDEDQKIEKLYKESQMTTDIDDKIDDVISEYLRIKARKETGLLEGEELLETQYDENLKKFLEEYFIANQYKLIYTTQGYPVVVEEVIRHNKTKCIFIFWEFVQKDCDFKEFKTKTEKKEFVTILIQQLTGKLNNFANFLRGEIARRLGYRKAPRVVFLKSKKSVFEEEMREDFNKNLRKSLFEAIQKNEHNSRTDEEIDIFLDSKISKFVSYALIRHSEIYSYEAVIFDIKKAFNSVENYLQKIKEAGHYIDPLNQEMVQKKVNKKQKKRNERFENQSKELSNSKFKKKKMNMADKFWDQL